MVTSAPAIDVTKISPESSSLGDLDGETRKMVEKMMVEQREKEAGEAAASGEEAKKREILKKFQEEHPGMFPFPWCLLVVVVVVVLTMAEMDFSNAQMG